MILHRARRNASNNTGLREHRASSCECDGKGLVPRARGRTRPVHGCGNIHTEVELRKDVRYLHHLTRDTTSAVHLQNVVTRIACLSEAVDQCLSTASLSSLSSRDVGRREGSRGRAHGTRRKAEPRLESPHQPGDHRPASPDQRSTCPKDCVMPGAGSAVEPRARVLARHNPQCGPSP